MQKRLSASSLVEITVAAVILVLVFTLALTICAQLGQHHPAQRQLRGQQLVQQLAATTIRTHAWYAKTTMVGPITLERIVSPYQGKPHLLQLQIQAMEQDEIIAHYQEVIYVPPSPTP